MNAWTHIAFWFIAALMSARIYRVVMDEPVVIKRSELAVSVLVPLILFVWYWFCRIYKIA